MVSSGSGEGGNCDVTAMSDIGCENLHDDMNERRVCGSRKHQEKKPFDCGRAYAHALVSMITHLMFIPNLALLHKAVFLRTRSSLGT